MRFNLLNRLALLLLTLGFVASCQSTASAPQPAGFRTIIGASEPSGSGLDVCADYGARFGCGGRPYEVNYGTLAGNVKIKRHQGMDFRASAGTTVIAVADGRIAAVRPDDFCAGGSVLLETGITIDNPYNPAYKADVFVNHLHIRPLPGLKAGQEIKAGTPIGEVLGVSQKYKCIGSVAHVHLQTQMGRWAGAQHVDPSLFWADGPGKVSCFDHSDPPPPGRFVAPLLCQ